MSKEALDAFPATKLFEELLDGALAVRVLDRGGLALSISASQTLNAELKAGSRFPAVPLPSTQTHPLAVLYGATTGRRLPPI